MHNYRAGLVDFPALRKKCHSSFIHFSNSDWSFVQAFHFTYAASLTEYLTTKADRQSASPLTPELNLSMQRCLMRFFTADFAS
jgi:hypothetical protein